MSRPKGSKNHPKLIETVPRRREPTFLSIPKDCLKIVHDRAKGSGLSPQMVLEDLIIAGDFTMGPAYDNLTNFRNRIRSKATQRNHVQPVTNIQETQPEAVANEQGSADNEAERSAPVQNGSHDVAVQRGHRPEDNPAFRDPGSIGDVTGVVGQQVMDPYPSEEPPYEEPQEAQEEFSEFEEP